MIKITEIPASKFENYVEGMNRATRAWEEKAARGETGWICATCCCSFSSGMPDECAHGLAECTAIIKRDKAEAMREGNELF